VLVAPGDVDESVVEGPVSVASDPWFDASSVPDLRHPCRTKHRLYGHLAAGQASDKSRSEHVLRGEAVGDCLGDPLDEW
jgi:hypothetical protein